MNTGPDLGDLNAQTAADIFAWCDRVMQWYLTYFLQGQQSNWQQRYRQTQIWSLNILLSKSSFYWSHNWLFQNAISRSIWKYRPEWFLMTQNWFAKTLHGFCKIMLSSAPQLYQGNKFSRHSSSAVRTEDCALVLANTVNSPWSSAEK